MKTMKVTANSTLHPISQSFRVPMECGEYHRRCPNPCTSDCVCGWPVGWTKWDAPEGFTVHAEWANGRAGNNNIVVVVELDDGGECWDREDWEEFWRDEHKKRFGE